jgi:type 1 glutamine amidotransferase
MSVLLTSGEVLSGIVRPMGEGRIVVTDSNAKERAVSTDEIDDYKPSDVSVMPKGIDEKIGKEGMRDLLTFLTTAEPKPPASAEGHLPPKRAKAEVEALLAAVPKVNDSKVRPLNIVLVASPQDHGPGEHDYPAWQAKWKDLLAKAPKVRVSTAFGWPEQSQFDLADVVIFYFWNHDWSKERYDQLDRYMARGGGVVVIHAATIADKEPEQLAQRIGLAYKFGPAKYRHGLVTLDIAPGNSPITSGLTKLDLVDETYWGITGEPSRVGLLATATEEGESRPILWTYEPESGGRTFASVIGHYSWTFDDPFFRTILLRGIAWSAGEPEGRLQPLAIEGIELE